MNTHNTILQKYNTGAPPFIPGEHWVGANRKLTDTNETTKMLATKSIRVSEYDEINSKIEILRSKIKSITDQLLTIMFMEVVGLEDDDLKHVEDFKIYNEWEEPQNMPEYSSFQSGKLIISYKHTFNDDNKPVEVLHSVTYTSETTYHNRYNPYVDKSIHLSVKNVSSSSYSYDEDGVSGCTSIINHLIEKVPISEYLNANLKGSSFSIFFSCLPAVARRA